MDTLLYRASTNSWCREVDEHEDMGSMPSMLGNNERRMLHWWARELPLTDSGYIVDAGCFLGGSTNAFVTGLAKNPYVQEKFWRIHAYDMFIAPRENYSLELICHSKVPGDSVIEMFVDGLIIENLDFEAKLRLMNEEIELSGNLHSRFFNAITTAWLVFEHGGIQKARKYLSSIDSIAIQPWHSEKPYVDIVLSAMEHLGDISGLEKYQNQYFKK